MMTLLFGIKDVMWRPFCFQNNDTITLGQVSYPFTFFANLMKLAEIF